MKNEKLISKALRFFSGTALSRFSGFARDLSMAYAFGVHPSVAALMVAFRLSNLLRRLLGEGAMQSAFIPQFEKLKSLSTEEAYPFFYELKTSLSVFLLFLIGLGSLALSSLLYVEGLSVGNQEIIQLTLLLCPSLFFICLYGINSSFLQCEGFYFIPAFAPVGFNVVWTLSALSLAHLPMQEAMRFLAVGIDAACFFQWLLTLPFVYRALRAHLKTLRPKLLSKKVRRFIAPLSLGLIGAGAMQINSALDALFARYADPSGPAYLWYAIRLQQLPLSLFGIAISSALLPSLSRFFASGEKEKYQQNFAQAQTLLQFILWPAALFLIAFAPYCIYFLYARGDFDTAALLPTSTALAAYSLSLLPAAQVLILAPTFYAKHDYKTPLKASLLSVLCNSLLNYLLVFHLQYGATSVALATAASAYINHFYLKWKLEGMALSFSWRTPLKAIIALCITLGMEYLLIGENAFRSYFSNQWEPSSLLFPLFGCYSAFYLAFQLFTPNSPFSLYSIRLMLRCDTPRQTSGN